nr:sulfite exporter TauE/SafE family protein [Companilactobacillus tucceti]
MLFGAFIRTVFGFGDALIAMPMLTLISFDLKTSTALIGAIGLLVAIPATLKYSSEIDWSVIKRLVIGSIFGVPVGITLVKYVDVKVVGRILGLFLLIYSSYSLIQVLRNKNLKVRLYSKFWDYIFGWISGILGSAFDSHGVAVAIYGTMKEWTANEFRGILQSHFMCVSLIVVSSQMVSGFWNMEVVKLLLMTIPFLFILIPFSNWVGTKINSAEMVKYVYGLLLLFGIMLLIKG